ncbi:MAG: HAMP domain-containing sensor histidine kinase [Acidobacteriota bacterium]
MSSPAFPSTVEHFASRLVSDHASIAQAWLERLDALIDVPAREIFPTHQLLDHIPDLIVHIADYVRAPQEQEVGANTAVLAKAAELGLMRFDQRATVHQLMREYHIFAELLERFFEREIDRIGPGADLKATVVALGRAQHAVRVLQQKTVDTFITRYSETIERQTGQLRDFGRLVSHEIRQPLGVLQVLTRMMPTGDVASARLAQTLERNVVRLGEVSGKLERLARLTRRLDNAPNEQAVDLMALSRDVARQLEDMADARGVVFHIAHDLPTFTADAGRVELVVMNLLANAVKYSDPAKPSREVRVESGTDVAHPRLHIADNGIGVPAAKLELIFGQFVRVHAHLDDELGAQGLGLGLSIVRECMDAMGGTVTVQSAEGVGTTFTLDWPASAPITAVDA